MLLKLLSGSLEKIKTWVTQFLGIARAERI